MPNSRKKKQAATPAGNRTRQIVIRNLTVPMRIGYYGHEKARLQPVLINLLLTVWDTPVRDNDLSSVVDYVAVVARIRKLSNTKHIGLAETLAEKIARICLRDKRVRIARVRVEKLDAIHDVEGAGIELERAAK